MKHFVVEVFQPPVSFSFIGPDIITTILFSDKLNLLSSLERKARFYNHKKQHAEL
jgi:hypothetical protein